MQSAVTLPSRQEEAALDQYYRMNHIACRDKDVAIWRSAPGINRQVYQVVINVSAYTSAGLVSASVMTAGGILGGAIGGIISTAGGVSSGPAAPLTLPPMITVGMVQGASIGSSLMAPLAVFLANKTASAIQDSRKFTVAELYEKMPLRQYNEVVLPILQRCFVDDDILTCPISGMPIVIPAKTNCRHIYELSEIVKMIFFNREQQKAELEQKHAGEQNLPSLLRNITYRPTPCPMCRADITFDSLKIGPEVFREIYKHYKDKFVVLKRKIRTDGMYKVRKRLQDNREQLSAEVQQLIPAEREQKVERERKHQVGENLMDGSEDELIGGMDITENNIKRANNNLYRLRVNDFLEKAADKGLDPAETMDGIKVLMNEFSLRNV